MSSLTVASAQFELRAEPDFASFAAHLTDVVERAVDAGGELVVLPELVTTGLLASVPDGPIRTDSVASHYRSLFPSLTGQLSSLLRKLAVRLSVTLLGGSHYDTADDGSLRNVAILAHRDGTLEFQDKLHLTPPEHALGAVGGNDVLITSIGPFTAAIQICADIEFPEVPRHLAENGVDMILTPSLTWNRRGAHRVRYGAHARAMENQLFVVTSPLIGSSGLPEDTAMHCTGTALVAGPIDRTVGAHDGVLTQGHPGIEEVIVGTLDPSVLAASRARPEVPGLALRRPDLYASLQQPAKVRS